MKQPIGEFLATLRKANGYTQQEIADELGISNKTLSNWECDKALPDILLLPALADLYGVTVDEILSGERKLKEERALSNKSEKNLLRAKLAKFDVGAWIITGFIIVGLLVFFLGACDDVTELFTFDFELYIWLMIAGFVSVAVCVGVLFLIWHSAVISVDGATELYPSYCINLRKKLVTNLYVSAIWTLIQALIVFYIADFNRENAMYAERVVIVTAYFVLPMALLAFCWCFFKRAIVKFGGDKDRLNLRADKNYFWTVALFGLFPAVIVAVICLILAFAPDVTITDLQITYVAVGVIVADVIVCFTLCLKRRFARYSKLLL